MAAPDNSSAEIHPEAIAVLNKIGSGSFGEVFLVNFNGTEAAAKVIPAREATIKMIDREVRILKLVQHPNIVACLGACQKGGYCYILQEYCAGGCLFELVHNSDHLELSWQQQWQWLHDGACAMEFLHSRSIIHRDLKSLNCLLASPVLCPTDQVPLKIADFGMGKAKENLDWGKMTIAAGTCHWMAPEVFTDSDYAEPVDVYSFSMLMFEIICREVPFEEEEPGAVGRIAVAGGRPDMDAVPPDCPQRLSALMVACWDHEPGKRPTFKELREALEGIQSEVSMLPPPPAVQLPISEPAECTGSSDALPKPSLPEDILPSPEPDEEFQERHSDALRVKVRCERSRVSPKRRELLGMITIMCPEQHAVRLSDSDASGLQSFEQHPLPSVSNRVALPQPSEEPEPSRAAKNRLGLDLVLVLDVSGSMSGEKLGMLKQAACFMVEELGSNDRLALVTFSTTAREHLNFCRMDEDGRQRALGIVSLLGAHDSTSIAAGLRLGIGLADARQSRNPVSGLLLLTDGQNNYGTIPFPLVLEARERGLSTYAFGIGADHDAALLGRIAEQARTPVAYIERPEALAGAFAATIGGLTSVRARNVELSVTCIGGTEIKAVHSPYLEHMTPSDARLVVPDLFSGERRDVLLDIDAPSGIELLEVSVRFRDECGPATVPKCRLQISRGEPETEPDDDFSAQRERQTIADLLKEALQEGRAGHVIKARKILEAALQRPWRPEHRSELEDSLKRLGAGVAAAKSAAFASLADVAQMHSHQRCLYSSPGLGGSNGSYLTSGQLQAIARSK